MKYKYNKKLLILIILLIVALYVFSSNNSDIDLSNQQLNEDFDYLIDFLENNYVFFDLYKNKTGIDWYSNIELYRSKITPTTTPQEFYNLVRELLDSLDDGHTFLIPVEKWDYYYNLMKLTMGSATTNDGMKYRTRPFFSKYVKSMYRKWNRIVDKNVDGSNLNLSVPRYNNLLCKILEKNRVAYLKIHSFCRLRMDDDIATLEKFYLEILDYPYLIIDISENSGGSDHYWVNMIVRPLLSSDLKSERYLLLRDSNFLKGYMDTRIKEIVQLNNISELPERFNSGKYNFYKDFAYFYKQTTQIRAKNMTSYKGKILMMISEKTSSAANNLAYFARNSGWATLIGKNTKGEGTIDIYTSLPNSGLVIRTDLALVLNNDGSINKEVGTEPDIMLSEMDNALENVLKYIINKTK